jgi:hypothetical protein
VDGEEDVEQVAKGDFRRIVGYLHNLDVPGIAGADLTVGRIVDVSTHVAGERRLYAGHAIENGLDTPKSPAT